MIRTLGAWTLIALGLAGVVGGLGMLYIHLLLPTPGSQDEAWAQTLGFYGGGCSGIVFGSALLVLGVVLRAPRSGSGKRKRGRKRDCSACGATSAPGSPKCYRCGR